MSKTGLQRIAILMLALIGVAAFRAHDAQPRETAASFALDTEHRRVAGPGRLDRSGDYVLRLALVLLAKDAPAEAVLDAVEIPLAAGEDFAVDVGFETPDPNPMKSLSVGHAVRAAKARRSPQSSRRLPPEFGGIQLSWELTGRYHGEHGGLHLLSFIGFEGRRMDYGPGYSIGGTGQIPLHSAAMWEDQPIARVYLDGRRLAVFAVVTRRGSLVVAAPGQRASWQKAFAIHADEDPTPDRQAIRAATEALDPEFPRRASGFLSFGPLMESLSAAYVLRDADSVLSIQDRFRADSGLWQRVLAAGVPEAEASGWFMQQVGSPWLAFMLGWTEGSLEALSSRSRRVGALRVLGLTEDADVARQAVDYLAADRGPGSMLQFVLATETLGRTAPVRAEYRRWRGLVIAEMGLPWSFAFRSTGALLAYSLLVPILALLLVISVRPNPSARRFLVSRTLILAVAAGTMVTLGEFPLLVFLAPVWWVLTWRWLREPVRHGWLERGFLWLILTLVTIRALQVSDWFFTAPTLDSVVGSAPLLCWVVVGLWILRDGRWRDTDLFAGFLWISCLLLVTTAFGLEATLAPIPVIALVIGLLALLGFVVRGHGASPSTGSAA